MEKELDDRKVAGVIVAKNLNYATQDVQIQALELIRNKRIFSRAAMHTTSKIFLFIALLSTQSGRRLAPHLNDLFAIAHRHTSESHVLMLERTASQGPGSSNTATPNSGPKLPPQSSPLFTHADLSTLRASMAQVRLTAEVAAYLHNIVVFMRMSRYVAGGVSAPATAHLKTLVKALAVLHSISYVTPSLVALAARKVYLHRIRLVTPETERSMQWGSDIEAVRAMLQGATVEDVIEDVLASVETPL
ncbi:hypothetical protein LTR66_003414 [Elasticomyces elasticus]|nr:hypothetical protein LTR66_003414 [Elasticomyces elasticus]